MKNLITSIACIMILLVFVLQFTQNQVLHNRLTAVDQAINSFKEIVKQEGCISEDNERCLKESLASIIDCNKTEIKVDGDKDYVYRGQVIHYVVEVPIRDIIVAKVFWGLGEKENQMDYITDRYTTSEYIGR